MSKSRLSNPCQDKESKQKKHDKRDKRNANECLFNTSLCPEAWLKLRIKIVAFFWALYTHGRTTNGHSSLP